MNDENPTIPQVDSIEALDSLDLSNTDTARPLIKDSVQTVRLIKMELKPQKTGSGKNLRITLALNTEAPGVDEKTVRAGFQHTETTSLVPTENYNPGENLARVQECFLGKKGRWNSAELIGKLGNVRFRTEKDTGFGPQNRVTWLKAKAAGDVPSLA